MDRVRGNTLVAALLVIMVLAGLALGFMETGVQTSSENVVAGNRTRVFYIAEAGVNDAIANLMAGGDGNVGTSGAPVPFGGGSYWAATTDHGDDSYTVLANALLSGQRRAIEVVLAPEVIPVFAKALFGDLDLGAEGSVFTDSYDSEAGTYNSQAVNVHPEEGSTYAGDQGSLGSNQNITLRGNVTVMGNATPGPGHSISISGTNVFVAGSTAPAATATALKPMKYDPPISASGAFKPSNQGETVIHAGTYRYTDFTAASKAKVIFRGDVTLYVDGNIRLSGQAQLLVGDGATVTLHHNGTDLSLTGGGVINETQLPTSFRVFTAATTVKFAGNSAFFGAIYAPHGTIKPTGTTDIFGSFVARQIDIGGTANFHYDEALSRSYTTVTRLKRVSWRWVAPATN